MKKTRIGYYRETAGGYSDPECTHVILTREEYDQRRREVSEAERAARTARQNAGSEVQKARMRAQQEIADVKAMAEQRIAELEKALTSTREECAFQQHLNANLLRIARERANAERKLTPKKAHSGYVVLSSIEKEERYRDRQRRLCAVTLWETVLQTPYTVDFEDSEVRRLIWDLFQESGDKENLIHSLGITGCFEGKYEDMIDSGEWREVYPRYNVMLDSRLRANYRAGYWELLFLHTKPLAPVPKNMRVR